MNKKLSFNILLLFFVGFSLFTLTSCFQKAPVQVETPPAVSEEKDPVVNMISIWVKYTEKDAEEPQGKIFLSFVGDETLSSETLRRKILDKAISIYNNDGDGRLLLPNEKMKLSKSQQDTFVNLDFFGLPFSEMCEILEKKGKDLEDSMNKTGVPIDSRQDMNSLNDFQVWMKAVKEVVEELNLEAESSSEVNDNKYLELYEKINSGTGISIQADKEIPFPVINNVFENLRFLGLNKFTLMTSLKEEE